MNDLAIALAALAASLSAAIFVVAYASRLRWEETAEGRSLMGVSIATAVVAAVVFLRRLDDMLPSQDWSNLTVGPAVACWLVVAGVFVWRIRGILGRRK